MARRAPTPEVKAIMPGREDRRPRPGLPSATRLGSRTTPSSSEQSLSAGRDRRGPGCPIPVVLDRSNFGPDRAAGRGQMRSLCSLSSGAADGSTGWCVHAKAPARPVRVKLCSFRGRRRRRRRRRVGVNGFCPRPLAGAASLSARQYLPEPEQRRLAVLARHVVNRPAVTKTVAQLSQLCETDVEHLLAPEPLLELRPEDL